MATPRRTHHPGGRTFLGVLSPSSRTARTIAHHGCTQESCPWCKRKPPAQSAAEFRRFFGAVHRRCKAGWEALASEGGALVDFWTDDREARYAALEG